MGVAPAEAIQDAPRFPVSRGLTLPVISALRRERAANHTIAVTDTKHSNTNTGFQRARAWRTSGGIVGSNATSTADGLRGAYGLRDPNQPRALPLIERFFPADSN